MTKHIHPIWSPVLMLLQRCKQCSDGVDQGCNVLLILHNIVILRSWCLISSAVWGIANNGKIAKHVNILFIPLWRNKARYNVCIYALICLICPSPIMKIWQNRPLLLCSVISVIYTASLINTIAALFAALKQHKHRTSYRVAYLYK